jgi:glutaredoxin-related protein
MLEGIRTRLYGALASRAGNKLLPVRLAKGALLYANDVVGRPLAPATELEERRAFEAEIAARRAGDAAAAAAAAEAAAAEQAPVVVFHNDRSPRELAKIVELLEAEEIEVTVRDVSGDEAAESAAKMDSGGARFPMVFIAGDFVGGAEALTNMVRSGELRTRVFGA